MSVLNSIFVDSFMTGSRVFGSNTLDVSDALTLLDSDWDIVVPITKIDVYADMFTQEYKNIDIVQSAYFAGKKIAIFDNSYKKVIELNLIPTSINDYRIWYFATLAFRDMWPRTGIKSREHKLAVFESLRASLRGRIEEVIDKPYSRTFINIAREARENTLKKATTELFNVFDECIEKNSNVFKR